MQGKNLGDNRERFFFNMNVFDEPEEEEIIEDDLPPPPPTFSEAELEAAKQDAFAAGKAEGIAETRAARSAALAETLGRLTDETVRIFADERAREKLYEAESVKLAHALFKDLFPLYNAQLSFSELQHAIEETLKEHNGHQALHIQVSEDMAEGVQGFMEKMSEKDSNLSFKVNVNAALQDGDCSVAWEDGGFIRNTSMMAEQIQKILEETLAAQGVTGHDEKVEAVEPVQAEAETDTEDQAPAQEEPQDNAEQDVPQQEQVEEPLESQAVQDEMPAEEPAEEPEIVEKPDE